MKIKTNMPGMPVTNINRRSYGNVGLVITQGHNRTLLSKDEWLQLREYGDQLLGITG